MKIGITGATGQLGQRVVAQLKGQTSSENIVALVRSTQKAAGLGVESREFDYVNIEGMVKALNGIDALLLISGNEIGQRAIQHSNIINAAKEAGIRWIVYTSLLHADTSTLSLAGEHVQTELALKASGIAFTILRNGWYTENYTGSLGGALAGGALVGSAGEGRISSATRADFAAAAVAVLTGSGHQGKTYELAGDTAYTLAELAAEVSLQTGKVLPYQNLPEADYAAILKSFGLPDMFAGAIASCDVSASKGDLFDEGKQLSQLIGRPTTDMKTAVAEALAAIA